MVEKTRKTTSKRKSYTTAMLAVKQERKRKTKREENWEDEGRREEVKGGFEEGEGQKEAGGESLPPPPLFRSSASNTQKRKRRRNLRPFSRLSLFFLFSWLRLLSGRGKKALLQLIVGLWVENSSVLVCANTARKLDFEDAVNSQALIETEFSAPLFPKSSFSAVP